MSEVEDNGALPPQGVFFAGPNGLRAWTAHFEIIEVWPEVGGFRNLRVKGFDGILYSRRLSPDEAAHLARLLAPNAGSADAVAPGPRPRATPGAQQAAE